ncbi:hypothetical protein HLB23_32580 [Nocardia uniformis]|uniref:Uncharacterized protein n=1 Tax=Nocardia uniformis TaxID=53432 RepID=A0A849C7F6_9NOCA|nr:DUF6069 family protein [Nocardia uniformis]NNH74532.1 hypothetical protein [Nocardia uniformis]
MSTTATATTATATAGIGDRIPALNRPTAVLGAVIAAVAANIVVWLIGAAAGGSFEVPNGTEMQSVAPGGVIILSAVPLLIGLTAAALLSYRWVGVLRLAAITGSVLTVATIAMTVAAEFDTASTIALSVMHLVLVPALVIATEGLRRNLIAK